jgi:NADPH:quinone reductase-like Zn-dependent oxidoreductase
MANVKRCKSEITILKSITLEITIMKAFVCEKYGPPEVLQLKEVEKPTVKENEILIKVHATTVNAADCNVRGQSYIPPGLGLLAKLMLGFKKPKISITGSVFAGVVEAAGEKVTSFKAGDEVYGTGPELGGYAEYTCRPVSGAIAMKPENISFEQAATVPYGALTSLYFLREVAMVAPGQKVLINGASGGLGVYAVQLARYFGAEVTGVCSTRNVDFVKSLGATRVIDYTFEDPANAGEHWDIIFDVVVGKTSFKRFRNSMTTNGYYLAVAGGLKDMLQMLRTSIIGGKKVKFGGGSDCEKKDYMLFLNELIESGELRPVVDRTFRFGELVEAHRYTEGGARRGSVAVTLY